MKRKHTTLAIAALGVELAAGPVPEDIRLIPSGEFRAWDGRPAECAAWVCTDEDGLRLVAEAEARTSASVIDYEHATLHAKKTGAKAPAAGWYKQLEWRAGDGLWAIGVDWTALAAQDIAGKAYRYISPVFSYDPKTGRVQKLFHAALTNDPGLDGLTDLAALAAELFLPPTNPLEISMNELLKKLLAALGLAETVTEAEALAAVASLKTNVATLSAQVGSPDPAKFVPIASLSALQGEHATLQTQFVVLQAEVNGGKLDKVIADGLASGKITPATESCMREIGKQSLAQLTALLDKLVPTVALGATQTNGQGSGTQTAALSAEAKQVVAALGLTVEQFNKAAQEA